MPEFNARNHWPVISNHLADQSAQRCYFCGVAACMGYGAAVFFLFFQYFCVKHKLVNIADYMSMFHACAGAACFGSAVFGLYYGQRAIRRNSSGLSSNFSKKQEKKFQLNMRRGIRLNAVAMALIIPTAVFKNEINQYFYALFGL